MRSCQRQGFDSIFLSRHNTYTIVQWIGKKLFHLLEEFYISVSDPSICVNTVNTKFIDSFLKKIKFSVSILYHVAENFMN